MGERGEAAAAAVTAPLCGPKAASGLRPSRAGSPVIGLQQHAGIQTTWAATGSWCSSRRRQHPRNGSILRWLLDCSPGGKCRPLTWLAASPSKLPAPTLEALQGDRHSGAEGSVLAGVGGAAQSAGAPAAIGASPPETAMERVKKVSSQPSWPSAPYEAVNARPSQLGSRSDRCATAVGGVGRPAALLHDYGLLHCQLRGDEGPGKPRRRYRSAGWPALARSGLWRRSPLC